MIKKSVLKILTVIIFILLFSSASKTANASQEEEIYNEIYEENGLVYEIYSDHSEVLRYEGESADLIIPKQVKNKDITAIKDEAFFLNQALESIVIPETVESIGDYAFYSCYKLKSVKMADSVSYLGEGAFYSCYEMSEVSLSKGLEKIENYTFGMCSSLNSIEIPEGITEIGDKAFISCWVLDGLKLPETLKIIGDWSFGECASLEQLQIPSGVERIGGSAFANTPWFKNLTDEFVILGSGVLIKYNGNEDIVQIPDTVKCISGFNPWTQESVDYFEEKLENVIIPESVFIIEDYAFEYCLNVEKITIPGNVKSIGDFAFVTSGIKNVEIQEGTTTIGESAFSGCRYLVSVSIPDSVKSIGKDAFSENNILKEFKYTSGSYAEQYLKENYLTVERIVEKQEDGIKEKFDNYIVFIYMGISVAIIFIFVCFYKRFIGNRKK